MLNRTIAIILLFAVISSSFSRLFIYAGFNANQKYIASTFCENKNRPWLHCNGKCYLMKKLKQSEEKQKSEERRNQKSPFQEIIVHTAPETRFHTKLLATISTPYTIRDFALYESGIFQPPK
jgi:hypothetical protein